jgi:competence protein ComEC
VDNRPALKFCLLLSAGILLGAAAAIPPVALFWSTSVLLLAAVITPFVFPGRQWIPALPGVPLLVLSLGALLISVDLGTVPADDPARWISTDTVTVSGTVLEMSGRSERSARFLVECTSLSKNGLTHDISGRVLVGLSGRGVDAAAGLVPGRQIEVTAPLSSITPARNPGEIDWRAHYELSGIRARMSVRSPWSVRGGAMSTDGFMNRFVVPVRSELSSRLASLVGDREARFLNGLILGERNEVPSDLKADFVTVGVMHLLAISGQQVVIVALLIAALLTVLRIPETPRFVIVACALAYYVLLTGSSPSVTRAGIMSIVMLGSRIAQRRPDLYNALGIAAAAILLWDPKQLFDPGFLLSFSAVLAIVLLYPLIIAATPALTAWCSRNRILDVVWKGAAVSLAAGFGTAPIVAYYFGRVSLVGFLANIIIVPLSSLALVLGMLTVGASFVWNWLASVYAAAADASAWLTFKLVGFFAGFPAASVNFRVSLAVLASVYAMLALILVSVSRKSWKPVLVGSLVLCNVAVYWWAFSPRQGDLLRVTFLDVGQGDAAFVEFPGGSTMLIDGGPKTFSFDAGERTVVPFLKYRGVGKIDYMVLSHPHGDHLGGLAAVMRAIPVGTVVEGGSIGRSTMYTAFTALADSLHVPRVSRYAGDLIGGGLPVRVYVLSPERGSGGGTDDLNEHSEVLKICYGHTSVLFPGDAEDGAESGMVSRYGRFLDSDILKAGHHGSITSSTGAFLGDVSPAWTVISSGEGNSFGHPSGVVLGRLSHLGSAILRTDRSGAAVFESDGSSWSRMEWR